MKFDYIIIGAGLAGCVLANRLTKNGKYNIAWNGSDMVGTPVASGSYLVVMKFGNSIQTKKIKLIK